jgi:hypothetical protein
MAAAAVAALAAGLSMGQVPRAKDRDHADHATHGTHSAVMEKCIKACTDCAKECDMCITHCTRLLAQGHKEHLHSARTCADCAEFCVAAARMTARHGPFMGLMCDACAKACDGCAAACEKHPNDEMMRRCAKACRDCAAACREMVKAVGTDVTRN